MPKRAGSSAKGQSAVDLLNEDLRTPDERAAFTDDVEALVAVARLVTSLNEARGRTGIKKVELARRLGRHAPAVSRLFGGGANPTLKTFIEVMQAMGLQARITLEPRRRRASVLEVESKVPAVA